MTYARWFLVGFLTTYHMGVNGGLGFCIFYGMLTAHFFVKSLPWANTHFKKLVEKYRDAGRSIKPD